MVLPHFEGVGALLMAVAFQITTSGPLYNVPAKGCWRLLITYTKHQLAGDHRPFSGSGEFGWGDIELMPRHVGPT